MPKTRIIIATSFLQGISTANGVENIAAGSTCECDTETAAWAVDGGHAKYNEDETSAPADVTLEEFAAAIATLEEGDDDYLTKSGLPDVKALANVGLEISAKARDALWSELNPA